MKPLVSIIIPTYNRAHLIAETLDSVLAQTYTHWECIIVDDGSTDHIDEVVQAYVDKDARFRYFQRPDSHKPGGNGARNFGFNVSNGEFVKWFDSDDIMYSNLLKEQVSSFSSNTDVSVCKLEEYDFKENRFIKSNNIFSQNLIEDYLNGKIAFYVSGPLWKKSFLSKQKQLFDEEISNLDDWDFNLRMLYQIPVIKYIEEPLIYYRVHAESLSKEIGKLNINEIKSEFKAREKHVKLLKKNKKVDSIVLRKFISERYHFFLRESLVNKSNYKWYFFKMLLKKQIFLLDFEGLLKSCVGFVSYCLFKKGYKFIK